MSNVWLISKPLNEFDLIHILLLDTNTWDGTMKQVHYFTYIKKVFFFVLEGPEKETNHWDLKCGYAGCVRTGEDRKTQFVEIVSRLKRNEEIPFQERDRLHPCSTLFPLFMSEFNLKHLQKYMWAEKLKFMSWLLKFVL